MTHKLIVRPDTFYPKITVGYVAFSGKYFAHTSHIAARKLIFFAFMREIVVHFCLRYSCLSLEARQA